MGRTFTSIGSGAASMDFSTRSFTASSMLMPWLSASSAMGASNSSRFISWMAASWVMGAAWFFGINQSSSITSFIPAMM